MNAIGRYLLFVISMAGMILSDDPFTEKNKKKFLHHIFDLHNTFRNARKVPLLKRNESMDEIAHEILKKKIFEEVEEIPEKYGVNYLLDIHNNYTKLNNSDAEFVFSVWFNKKSTDNDLANQQISKLEAYEQILWEETKEIGLAIVEEYVYDYYAVIALYYPRYKLSTQEQVASNNSKPPTFDQGGPSII